MRKNVVYLCSISGIYLLLLAGCQTVKPQSTAASSPRVRNTQVLSEPEVSQVQPGKAIDQWTKAIHKPDHLDDSFQFTPDPQNPDRFVFENMSMGRSEQELRMQTVLDSLSELNAAPYTYEDLFRRFGLPSTIIVFKVNGGEHLSWYYGAVQFYIGTEGTRVQEARIGGEVQEFSWMGLRIGDPVEMIDGTIGPVLRTVHGNNAEYEQVLYRDYEGRTGNGYFSNSAKGVRVFVWNDFISNIYVFPPRQPIYLLNPITENESEQVIPDIFKETFLFENNLMKYLAIQTRTVFANVRFKLKYLGLSQDETYLYIKVEYHSPLESRVGVRLGGDAPGLSLFMPVRSPGTKVGDNLLIIKLRKNEVVKYSESIYVEIGDDHGLEVNKKTVDSFIQGT